MKFLKTLVNVVTMFVREISDGPSLALPTLSRKVALDILATESLSSAQRWTNPVIGEAGNSPLSLEEQSLGNSPTAGGAGMPLSLGRRVPWAGTGRSFHLERQILCGVATSVSLCLSRPFLRPPLSWQGGSGRGGPMVRFTSL